MVDKNQIEKIAGNHLEGTDLYLVSVEVSKSNVINVIIDGDRGVNIDHCSGLSRYIESQLDRDKEDFELRVTSPGIDKPFKLKRQFVRYINREIEITTRDQVMITGILHELTDEDIVLEWSKGKKQTEKVISRFRFEDIAVAKPVISFKS